MTDDTATPAEIALVLALAEGMKDSRQDLYTAIWRVCRGADHWWARTETR